MIIIPIFADGYYSLFDWDGLTKPEFVGFANYIELFTSKSTGFSGTLKNGMMLAFLAVTIQLPIALFLAIALATIWV